MLHTNQPHRISTRTETLTKSTKWINSVCHKTDIKNSLARDKANQKNQKISLQKMNRKQEHIKTTNQNQILMRIQIRARTFVSSMTAHKICVFCIAIFKFSRVSWWYSCVPCEKLNLATFIPARRSFSSIGTDREAGPSVHTIFVFGIRPSFGSSFKIPSMLMFAISKP